MKAAFRDRYGPPELVEVREVERPVPSADQVLVRVHAASVNRADLDIYPRWQFTRLFLGLRRPRVRRIGLDVAGVVESVGPDVTRFRPGDEVEAFKAGDVDTLKGLIAAGKLRPAIDRRYPLAEVVDALRYVDDGHARGKVVITM